MMPHRPADQPRIVAHDNAFAVHGIVCAQKEGGEHRRHEPGDKQRNENGHGDR